MTLSTAFSGVISAHPEISTSEDNTTIVVGDAPEQDVFVFGKSVIVKKHAKSALAVGGDVIIEGTIDGDVATIGGNIIQKENAYVGGDIIVFGGSYKPESSAPLREPGRETVMFGVFEEELKSLAQNPSQILSPEFTWSFLAQRMVLALIWFVISMVATTIAPGAFSRAAARIHLSALKVCSIGSVAFLAITIVIVGGLAWPNFLIATLGAMGIFFLLFGYIFGRITLQISVGKLLQKRFFPDNNRSETLATLAGVLSWTLLLSLPYIWIPALFAVFTFGIGLIFTARSTGSWQKA